MKIRKAKTEDLESINKLTDVMHLYLADLYGLKLVEEKLEDEHFEEEELIDIYIAQSEDEGIIGYISFSKQEDEWAGPNYKIEHLVVKEKYRGSGVGKRLFEMLLEKATQEKVNITTGILTKNIESLKFFEGLGFKPLSIGLLLDIQKRIFME